MMIYSECVCVSVKLLTSSLGLEEKRVAIVPEEHTSIGQLVDGLNVSSETVVVCKICYFSLVDPYIAENIS